MPNLDWKYNSGTGRWEAKFWPFQYQRGSYRGYWRNTETAESSEPRIITIIDPDPPVMILSSALNGAARTSFTVGDRMYGRVLNLSNTNAQSCTEAVGATDGACGPLNFPPWQNIPNPANPDWQWDGSTAQIRAYRVADTTIVGKWRTYWRNSDTGQRSAAVVWEITN
jgi:hypothetical protein